MKKLYIFLTITLFSSLSYATEWGNWSNVKEIFMPADSGSPYIMFTSSAMPNCYGDSGGYLSGSDIGKSYSTILAAFMSGKKVRPLYDINTGATGWGMCTITAFYIQ